MRTPVCTIRYLLLTIRANNQGHCCHFLAFFNIIPQRKHSFQPAKMLPGYRYRCHGLLYEIFGLCHSQASYVHGSSKIAEGVNYLQAHWDDPTLTIGQAAERANMSEVYFRKCFQAVYKIPPKKYLTSVRLEQARQAMRYSFLSLEECAFQCGFSSWQYFSRVFKNETGQTPASYRKKRYFDKEED